MTRPADIEAAAAAGADAVGFVCYARSPRHVPPAALPALACHVPAFVTPVLLFVDADSAQVDAALRVVPHALLQFHGSESPEFCASFRRPYLRAIPMAEGVDLLDCARRFEGALALLVDAPAPGHGGGGVAFDWSRLPPPAQRAKPVVLAGGLDAGNVAAAIFQVKPDAVDVSSGVEQSRGIKDPARIHQFIAAVRAAEQAQVNRR